MAKVTLKWELESKDFDTLKKELIEGGDGGMLDYVENNIGDNHCKLCALSKGMMCIKRSVCRIPENEVWVNKEITEIEE